MLLLIQNNVRSRLKRMWRVFSCSKLKSSHTVTFNLKMCYLCGLDRNRPVRRLSRLALVYKSVFAPHTCPYRFWIFPSLGKSGRKTSRLGYNPFILWNYKHLFIAWRIKSFIPSIQWMRFWKDITGSYNEYKLSYELPVTVKLWVRDKKL